MVERSTDTPAVFVVTIREDGGGSGQLQGSVTPVAASGREASPKRWFRSLDQLPAILRGLLSRLRE